MIKCVHGHWFCNVDRIFRGRCLSRFFCEAVPISRCGGIAIMFAVTRFHLEIKVVGGGVLAVLPFPAFSDRLSEGEWVTQTAIELAKNGRTLRTQLYIIQKRKHYNRGLFWIVKESFEFFLEPYSLAQLTSENTENSRTLRTVWFLTTLGGDSADRLFRRSLRENHS